jgi:hypothetical protein
MQLLNMQSRLYGNVTMQVYKTNITISLVYPGRINTNISKKCLVGDGKQYASPTRTMRR